MKRLSFLLLLTLVLVSCGTDGHHFKLEGRLRNLNQGEFYIYSTDGVMEGLDTIGIKSGRFAYEVKCENPGTLVIVFPNFSEQPVFAAPGKSVEIKGDATKLKELTVSGTKENKQMNQFREQIVMASPPEIIKYATTFIEDHPESIVSDYLLSKYFLKNSQPDYKKARELLKKMTEAQPENTQLKKLVTKIQNADVSSVGKHVTPFNAVDIFGNGVNHSQFCTGLAVIYTWATWDSESCTFQRTLKSLKEGDVPDVKALGISIDASDVDCFKMVEREDIKATIVRENGFFESKLIDKLGLLQFPDNIILKDGVIIARNVTVSELRDKLKQ